MPALDAGIFKRKRWGPNFKGGTLGIIGLGHSGKELVRLAAPFEMKVVAYSPHVAAAEAVSLGVTLTSLEELLKQSDFVSLHARYTPNVHHMIARRSLP